VPPLGCSTGASAEPASDVTQTPSATSQVKPDGHGVPELAHFVTPLLNSGL
jgi:hypothetical protein